MEEIGEWSVMAKTLSTDNYLQITRLMQAPVAERGNTRFSPPVPLNDTDWFYATVTSARLIVL